MKNSDPKKAKQERRENIESMIAAIVVLGIMFGLATLVMHYTNG